jgi:hypothetical protein
VLPRINVEGTTTIDDGLELPVREPVTTGV